MNDANGSATSGSPEDRLGDILRRFTSEITDLDREQRAADAETNMYLRSELDMMKRAYAHLQNEKQAVDRQVAVMQEQHDTVLEQLETEVDQMRDIVRSHKHTLDLATNQERQVSCFIDGDSLIFGRPRIAEGRSGGMKVARMLQDAIRAHVGPSPDYRLWIYYCMNRAGLAGPLNVGKKVFDEFITGFNSVGSTFFAFDVGYGKEAADHRLRELMQLRAPSLFTTAVYFGGCADNGYLPFLNTLITSGMKSKLVLLSGGAELSHGYKNLGLPVLSLPGLFESAPLPSKPVGSGGFPSTSAFTQPQSPKATPLSPSAVHPRLARSGSVSSTASSQPTSGGVPLSRASPATSKQPQAPSKNPPATAASTKPVTTTGDDLRLYTGSLTLGKNVPIFHNNPKPCTSYYKFGECRYLRQPCQFSHDYTFNVAQVKEMMDALPLCFHVAQGRDCKHPERCVYRHHCKDGMNCKQRQQGKCNAGGNDAHQPVDIAALRMPIQPTS